MAITKSTPAPLTGGTLWCVTIALSLATFMQMLDSTISNVAIPTISGFLGASTDEGTWVITSFGLRRDLFWINPILTGASPVQQSDCSQQSRSAATKDVVFLYV